jgi:hypothetical protein
VDAKLESRLVDLARNSDRVVFDSWALAWICPVPVLRIWIESDLKSRTRKCLVSLGDEPRPLAECEGVVRSKDDYNRAMFRHRHGFDLFTDRERNHAHGHVWWPSPGRSDGHQRAPLVTATGHFLMSLDSRFAFVPSANAHTVSAHPATGRPTAPLQPRMRRRHGRPSQFPGSQGRIPRPWMLRRHTQFLNASPGEQVPEPDQVTPVDTWFFDLVLHAGGRALAPEGHGDFGGRYRPIAGFGPQVLKPCAALPPEGRKSVGRGPTSLVSQLRTASSAAMESGTAASA